MAASLLQTVSASAKTNPSDGELETEPFETVASLGRLDRYELIREIGSGGMGVVYLARQLVPVRRDVALKVVKPTVGSPQMNSRFSTERQALCSLNHPNIAKVFDAGTAEDGRLYFAMELVEGISLTEFCNQERFTVDMRIRLLLQACRAMSHAHEKGVIHRDLKPSNMLATIVDGEPVLKVIDFGIAKVTSDKIRGDSYESLAGHSMGTPCYMSPEQIRGSEQTGEQSDVFSFGIILYELLIGTPPISVCSLREFGLSGLEQRLRDTSDFAPSKKFRSLTENQKVRICQLLSSERESLQHDLNEQLDNIVLKAIKFNPSERQPTAKEFYSELTEFLKSRSPVEVNEFNESYLFRSDSSRNLKLVAIFVVAIIVIFLTILTISLSENEDSQVTKEDFELIPAKAGVVAELEKSPEEPTSDSYPSPIPERAKGGNKNKQFPSDSSKSLTNPAISNF